MTEMKASGGDITIGESGDSFVRSAVRVDVVHLHSVLELLRDSSFDCIICGGITRTYKPCECGNTGMWLTCTCTRETIKGNDNAETTTLYTMNHY